MSKFVHLHVHSHYSFLQALPKINELIDKTKEEGMDAIALTDAGNMHGAIEFYKAATKGGIKPILGVDTWIAERSRFEHDPNEKRSRLVLLAENLAGYKNLLQLVTASQTEGLFDKPRMDTELLRKYSEGIIALIPSFSGNVPVLLASGNFEAAGAALAEYVSIFGKDNTFLEITHHPTVAGHTEKMKRIRKLSEESGVKLVAQHDVYYLLPEDREACAVLQRIRKGGKGSNEEEDFSFVGEQQMREWFKDIPEAVEESGRIAERCADLAFDLGKWIFPEFPIENGKTHDEELRARAVKGIETRKMEKNDVLLERMEYELQIIADKGFATYFLVISDLLSYAKSVGILTTTRGSAGGSLVSYLTGVTNIDPLFYKLPFERFLNPERPKAPDIDMDFADSRRDEVIAYAKRKYGADRVAQIGTFGTLLARAAVRDVSRALGHPYGTGDRIAKLIPLGSQGFPMTITRAVEMEPELQTLYDGDEDVHEIIDIAKKIEGGARHVGVHAAGVVIAPSPLIDWAPLQMDPKATEDGGDLITQYDMYSISDEYGGVGLLKFDFLGITNLSILADAVSLVKETRGIAVDIDNVPIDDTKTFEMLARGDTEGIFQLNGSGMTRYLKELKPTTIHDINAMVALYRPGPMETIPQYIERKKNSRLIHFIDPRMKEYLDFSYGLLVYQDDVLLTAIKLAGYTWLQADTLRKAMGKKIPEIMQGEKDKLLKGFVEYGGLSSANAHKLWELIEPFAAYGFGKAHAASYGKVAYQTAYMKANYPVEYMTALLTADAGETDKIAILVAESARMHIPVLPPDINESKSDFAVVGENKEAIRFGLTSIKNFGENVGNTIIAEREARGPFTSLSDFLSRIGSRNLNRKSLESLIKCGALDAFGFRSTLLENIEELLSFHRDLTTAAPQDSLFGATLAAPELKLKEEPPTPFITKLGWEKELLGIYVSGHPLDAYPEMVAKSKLSIAGIKESPRPGLPVILPVLVSDVRSILTKKGDKMAFIHLEDKTGSIEAVAFPKLFKENHELLMPGNVLLIKATLSKRNDELSLALENLKPL